MKLVKVTITGYLDVEENSPILDSFETTAYELHAGAGIVSDMKIELIEGKLEDLPADVGDFFDYEEEEDEE